MATWAAVCIAFAAAIVGLRQLGEARRLREAQAQPYVVVFAADSVGERRHVDLVIKNFGLTAATDVRATFSAPLDSAVLAPEYSPVKVPDVIPFLAPGQEWRTFWDFMPARQEARLPFEYRGQVSFKDYRGKTQFAATPFVLDLQVMIDRGFVEAFNIHHAARALREIREMFSQWTEADRTGLSVVARNGDEKDRRRRDFLESRRRQAEEKSEG